MSSIAAAVAAWKSCITLITIKSLGSARWLRRCSPRRRPTAPGPRHDEIAKQSDAEELRASPGDIPSALARYELTFGRTSVDYSVSNPAQSVRGVCATCWSASDAPGGGFETRPCINPDPYRQQRR